MRSYFRFTLIVLVVLATSVGLWAQAGTGSITGIISDPTGAVVANAQVTATNEATGITRTTKPTAAGVYNFTGLPVGGYTVTVDAAGFRSFKARLEVSTGTVFTQDVHLQVGAAKETVTVEAGAQTVQATDSSVSQLIGQDIWGHMPLETRNQNSFINLVAGATPDVISTRGASVNGARGGTGNYMVEGMDNNDQGQGGRGQLGNDPGGAATSISPDAIQEYRVITNSFAAEYGKAGGFVTDTVLKSGTNNFHGALFEYNRVQALAANNFFSNRTEDPFKPGEPVKDRLVRNQFGGAFGGPLIKDKTFFFGQLEFHRMRQSSLIHGVTTTQQFLDFVNSGGLQTWAESSPDGICMYYNGAPCPGAFAGNATLGPIFKSLLAQKVSAYPVANAVKPCATGVDRGVPGTDPCAGQGWYTNPVAGVGLVYPVPAYGTAFLEDPYQLNEYKIVGKFDHKLTNKDQLAFMWVQQHAKSGDPFSGGGPFPGPPYINEGISLTTGVSWTHTLSPTVLNTAKFSYLRHRSDFPLPDPSLATMPQILTADAMETGFGLYSGLPQFFTDNQFQWQDHLSFVRGKHSFKTGVEYRRTRNGSRFFNDNAGTYYGWAIEDLVTDMTFTDRAAAAIGDLAGNPGSMYLASASVDLTTGKTPDYYRGYRANELAAYFQDDWRITPRFTVNVGVRWEYFGPPHNFKKDIDSNFYFGNPTPSLIKTTSTNIFFPKTPFAASVNSGSFQIRNNEIWQKDTNNFGPRVGFAWDLFGNQKLVMRAGAGIMYDRLYNNVFENIRFNPPYFSDNQIGILFSGTPAGLFATPGLYTAPFSSLPMFNNPKYAPKPNPRHIDQNLVTAYMEQFHFGFQWEFLKGYVFEPEYVATMGHKLTGYFDINTFDGRTAGAAAGSSTRINSTIGADNFRNNAFSSNYHALQLSVRKNYANGLGFNANYTWSKVMDTLSDVFNFRTANVTDVQNIGYDYGPADFNLTHRLVANLSYELPFAKNNRWLGGWSLNTIFSIQSGVPFSIYNSSTGSSANDKNKDGRYNDRYVTVGGVSPASTVGGIAFQPSNCAAGEWNCNVGYFDTKQWSRYTCPATVNGGLWCNPPIGRNSMSGPGRWNQDLGITKRFKISEGKVLAFSGNMFNLFNHPNFGTPVGNASSPNFGQSASASDARVTQLALRFDF